MRLDVLEEFAEAQRYGERRVATEEGGLEALRAAYRARQRARGLCRSCRRPAVLNKRRTRYTTYCAVHRAACIARARASQARNP